MVANPGGSIIFVVVLVMQVLYLRNHSSNNAFDSCVMARCNPAFSSTAAFSSTEDAGMPI
jgi:hypothetical protein